VLSFLAHGPKRACGDVYSLLCALHAVCAELFPPYKDRADRPRQDKLLCLC